MVSQSQLWLSSRLGVYIEILDLFDNILYRIEDFALYKICILDVVRVGKDIFDDYYKLMDENPLYTIGAILDPRVKGT